jgi:hypothetical protein
VKDQVEIMDLARVKEVLVEPPVDIMLVILDSLEVEHMVVEEDVSIIVFPMINLKQTGAAVLSGLFGEMEESFQVL